MTPVVSPRRDPRSSNTTIRKVALRRRLALQLSALPLLGILLWSHAASGQGYPTKPINIVVPVAPGGIADLAARVFAAQLGTSDQARVTVENRTGGAGVPGTLAVARAPADGYTLLVGYEGPLSVMPLLQKLPYDPDRELAPIAHLISAPNILVVHPSVPAKNLTELIAYARANPGKLTSASQGVGSTGHLGGEMLRLETGIDITHVPYRGAAPAMQDLASGSVSVMFSLFASAQPLIADGKVRALGVTTRDRVSFMPDVPTLREQGVPLDLAAWFGLLAPAGTPANVIWWLNQRANALMAGQDVQARFTALGATLPLGSPEGFARFIASETKKFDEVVRKTKMSISEP